MNTKQATKRLALWTLMWLLCQALASFGPLIVWQEQATVTLVAIGLTVLSGIGMIHANIIHLRSLDELQQKIQLESMALTLGLVLVFGLAYSLLDTTDIISVDAEISVVVIFMGLTYLAAMLLNNQRYV